MVLEKSEHYPRLYDIVIRRTLATESWTLLVFQRFDASGTVESAIGWGRERVSFVYERHGNIWAAEGKY